MNLSDQIEWEQTLSKRGVERYTANQDRLRTSGEADKTEGLQYLLKERLQDVAKVISKHRERATGKSARYNRLLRIVTPTPDDTLRVALMGVQTTFQAMHEGRRNTLLKTAIMIGRRVEAELKCRMFQATNPAYYHVMEKSLKEQNVNDYLHKYTVYMKMFKKFELERTDLDPMEQSHLGFRVLDAVLEVFHDVVVKQKVKEFAKTIWRLRTTPEFDKWVHEFENARSLLNPMTMPCKIPPAAWDGRGAGGYYTPELKSTTRFIKTKSREHRKYTNQFDPVQHRQAVNSMQRTPWKINTQVLNVQQEIYSRGLGVGLPSSAQVAIPTFPPHLAEIPREELTDVQKTEVQVWKQLAKAAHGKEKKRQSAVVAFMQAYKAAQELRDWDKFYYVYTCDFRGRIYCETSGLSPQGADVAKGLITFAHGVKLGDTGVKWLAIQGANTYGEDKLPYADRVKWVQDNEQHIRQTAEDPIGSRSWWGEADKPYQFLAFCFEWVKCDYGRDRSALSSIPVGLDGSCNGLQHFSAMLRDEVGAKATNLLPCSKPEDIYQEVADVCSRFLATVDDPRARKWLEVGLTRKLAKRPVMTLPYGATQTSARQYVFEWCQDYWNDFDLDEKYMWEYAMYLTPHLWSAIGSTVTAATSGMSWLQRNVGNEYCKWLTPVGFPVYQYYKTVPILVVRTKLCGGVTLQLKIADFDYYGEPKKSGQKSGIAPNFVHSIDSTHMVMTINSTDFSSYAMIHDDYGTHAGNTEKLFKAIRVSFHRLYTKYNPLEDWGVQVGANMLTLPASGSYDIDDILKADYFFG